MERIVNFIIKYYRYIEAVVILFAVVVLAVECSTIRKQEKELLTAKNNVEALQKGVQYYTTKDGQNVATIESLNLTIDNYKKLRADDYKLISQLKEKAYNLKSSTKIETASSYQLTGNVKDTTIFIHDTIPKYIEKKHINYSDAWISIDIITDTSTYKANIDVRDSLTLIERVKYKRFLFWKTKKVKSKKIDVVSKNPHTYIYNIDFISIEE